MEGEGFRDSIKNMEIAYTVLRESIVDLTNCADVMEEYIKTVKNPIELIMNNNICEKLDTLTGQMQLYMAMAGNKLQTYSDYVDKMKGE